jgi:glycerol uptake facilitator-like aquaporin
MFSDTFAGIAPSSVPAFIAAQILGGALAVAVIRALYPRLTPAQASDIIFPHHASQLGTAQERAAYDGAASPAGRSPGHDAPH